ncbi:flavin-dependent dehydrogenase [Oscillatoria sp. FACHB-1406]|uniref:NAD(P)/FAD-dependent oxidoreductase n=1 Tax=Oscillatoria sp. FACHB-1406 TaxID=2692846 RepID=UPI001684ED4F|nr:flavin-dependent dehydrogenase [Oscillatoria sp. FACHB-1406]MBD2580647.1 flavin-dependent dehydrogenase [Oscillatoria sp. FACHB-1406]
MKELLYLEIPTPDTEAVRDWLHHAQIAEGLAATPTPDGVRLAAFSNPSIAAASISENELSIFTWSVQRTTYLKVFRWGSQELAGERQVLKRLVREIRSQFPPHYPDPSAIDLAQQSIFEALTPHYPKTVHFFQKMPQGEYDLNRVYWWEKRWRESVRNPQQPQQVVFDSAATGKAADYDLIYLGGALGAIHAAVMAQLGWKVLLVERLPFGRMNREWNISRAEFQSLIDLGLFSATEFESLIAREYRDGFNKFFDGNNPPHLKAKILHTPTVLNIAIDSEQLLLLCGEKLKRAGGEIWDETEFIRADLAPDGVTVQLRELPTGTAKQASGRLLVDAMGTASPIAWQRNGGRTFDSVCPTVGAIVSGIDEQVWDSNYGDVLNSHGDTSRGRQLIWELFPAAGDDLTIYLFHYHQVHPDNPGSLLEMYEDFFTILPEYRHCEMEALEWKKATFGYIPGHFSVGSRDRAIARDRLISIGDAASLQSPLVFTGFGSLVRNLSRLTTLLNVALKHDLLAAEHLEQIRAYQSNLAVTWLFSKGMMVPTGQILPPERVNAMLNTFFGLLANEPPEVADTFIKDRFDWLTFNRLAFKAARMNPRLVPWIWQQAGAKDFLRWLGSYFAFALDSLIAFLFAWLPDILPRWQPWLEKNNPALWLRLLSFSYSITAGLGQRYRSGVKVDSPPLPVRV